MEDEQYHKIQRILKLTLEFICLLTGEECMLVRKSPNRRPNHPKSHSMEPSSSTTMFKSDEKILQLIKKITELLTEEVPIRCQDVTVYFSMEEWEYLEGHKDLYKDVMMEDEPDGSRKSNSPQRCPHPLGSTQELHEIPQVHSVSSRDSTQKVHEIPQVYSQDSTQEHHQIPHTHSQDHQESTQKPLEIPQACPLYSQDSTQKHNENPQVHPLYPQESTQEHREILRGRHQFSRRSAHSSEKDGSNERNPPEKGPPPRDSWDCTRQQEIPQTCLPISRGSTRGHHTTPQKKVINQRAAACTPETTNYDSREKSLEVPLTEATAEEHHGSNTSNQTKANLDMAISPKTCRGDTIPGSLKDTNIVFNRKTGNEDKHSDVVSQSSITSKQTEPDDIACNLNIEATIFSKQSEPDTITWNHTKEAILSLKQTEPEVFEGNPTKEAISSSKLTEPNTVAWNHTKEATMSSKQTYPDAVTGNLTKKATSSSKQTEPDTVSWNLTKKTTISSKQSEPDVFVVNPTKEATISSKQTEPDTVAWNHTNEATISSKLIEDDTINENPTEADSALDNPPRAFRDYSLLPPVQIGNPDALVGPTTVSSKQAEADSITLYIMENATVSVKQTEPHGITWNLTKEATISSKQTDSTTVISTPTKSVDGPPRAFRDHKLLSRLEIKNPNVVACQNHITSNQADSITLHLTKEATVPLKQFEASVMSSNPSDADLKTTRDDALSPLLQNRNPSAMVCHTTINSNPTEAGSAVNNPSKALRDDTLSPPLQIQNTKVVVCQTSNQKEDDSGVVIPTDVCKADAPVSPLQDANNIFNSEAAKKTSIENSAAVTSIETKANSAVDSLTSACQDGTLPDTNISHSKGWKRFRNSKSVFGHDINALKKTEADLDGKNQTRVFGDDTLPAPSRDTNNIFSSDKTQQIAVNSSTAVVDHWATKENQTIADSAVDNTTTKDYTLCGLLKNTNNVSNFAARKNTNIKHSEAVTSHGTITSTNIQVTKDVKIPTVSSTDNTPSAPILDKNNSNSKKREGWKSQNTSGVVGHGPITRDQTKTLNNPTCGADDSLPASLKDTNNVSSSNATKNKILRNFRSVDGHSTIALNQTEANSAAATSTRDLRGDTLLAPVRKTQNTFKSLKTLRITITNSTALVVKQANQTEAVDNPTPPAYWDVNNFSNFEAIKNKQIEDSKASLGTTISENMKVMSALNHSTSTSKDDPPTLASKDTNIVSDCDTRARVIKKSNVVGGHSHITTNQSKSNSTTNDSIPVWMDDRPIALLKDANDKARTRNKIPAAVCHSTILSSQVENLQSLALNNPTRASKINALPATLKDTNNTISSEEMEDQNMTNPKSVAGHRTTPSNQTKGVFNKPTTCGEDSYIISLIDSKNISNSEGIKKNELMNSRSVIVYSAIASNRTEADSFVTNNMANYEERKKNSNPKSLNIYSAITSTKVDSAFNKPAATNRDNTYIASYNVSNPDGERNRNSTCVIGHDPIASIQTEVSSVVVVPTEACGNSTIPNASMKDPNDVPRYTATKNRKHHNSSEVLGHSSIPTNQTESNSASNDPTTSCKGDPNNATDYKATIRRQIQNSSDVVDHSPINTNQTEANSASNNPTTTCLDEILLFPLDGTNDVSEAAMKKPIAVIGYSTIKSNRTKPNTALNNPTTDNVPNVKASKKKNLKGLSVVASSAIISNQAKDDGALDNSTICKEDSRNALVKNRKQISNDEETKKNKKENSKSVIVYSTTTSNQSEASTAFNEPSTSFKDNKVSSPFKDINNVTTPYMKNNKNLTDSPSAMGRGSTTSNQPEVATVVDKPIGSYRDITAPTIVKDTSNASSSKVNKKRKIKKHRSVGGHSSRTSNHGTSVDNLPCREVSHIARFRASKSTSNSEEIKKIRTRNSKSVMVHSDQTVDVDLNKPAQTCSDQTPSPTENEANTVSKSVRTKTRRSTSAVSCDTITPIQTESENIQTQVDHTPPSSLKVPNNVSNSKAQKKRQMMISNATGGHSTTTSNQTQEGFATDNATDCGEDLHIAALKDTNNNSNSKETTKNQINSGPVDGHEAMSSKNTEDFSLKNSTKTHSHPSPPLEEANNVSNWDWAEGENIINPAAVVGDSTIISSEAKTNSAIEDPATVLNAANNTELNTEATDMKNADETDDYITLYLVEVSPFIDDPSIDHNNESQAPVVSSLDDPSKECSDNVPSILEADVDDLSHSKAPRVRKKRKRERNYKCSECGKMFLFNAHLVVHLRSHTGERPFLCPECGKGFGSKTWLAAHQKFHAKEKPYTCSECEKSFLNKTNLQVHLKSHKNERPYSCPDCRKIFIHKANCIKHQESHMVVRRHLCSYCGRKFSQSSHLREHLKQHTGELRFSCIKCRKRFQTEGALFSHYKIHQITPLSCSECSKHFINRVSFKRHQRIHTGHKLFTCSECGRCFINKTHLSIHLRIHSGERPYMCPVCEKRFTDKSACNKHIRTHTAKTRKEHPETAKGSNKRKSLPAQVDPDITKEMLTKHQESQPEEDPFPCSNCGQCFATEALLVAHKCQPDKNSFSCTKCDTGFKTQLELETHQKNHTEEKFACNNCNRCFADKMLLAIHKLKHLGNKLFSCEKCKKGFITQMELDAHVENHPELDQKHQHGEKEIPSLNNNNKGLKTSQELEVHQQNHLEKESFSGGDCGQCFDSEAPGKHDHGKNCFSCTKCNIGFATQSELETHEKIHPEKEFLCSDCNRRFTCKTVLAKHQKKHCGNTRFSCEKCKKVFGTLRELKEHEKNHPKLDQKPYPTEKQPSSDKDIKMQQELEGKQQSHVQRKPFRCSICGHRFIDQTRLEEHQKKHIEKRFLCLLCKKSFKTQPELKTHQKNQCDEKAFICGDCGRRFASEALLAEHQERHVSKKRYTCLECGHGFNEKSNFEKHCRIHTGERPYSCPECGKAFAVKSNMIRHSKIHTGDLPYKCLECTKSFRGKSYLIAHQKTHTSVQEYACSHCSKTFQYMSNYLRHRKSHIEGKKFPCTECSKSFSSPTQLTIHARTHSRQKFECAFCGKNFKNNWGLNKHTKIHTRKK